jgi:glycogen synthase
MGKYNKTAVLLIAPETGQLPEDMGPLARYISGKSGGLGDVIAALSEGLTMRGIECHLATLNLKKRFQQECGLDDNTWHKVRHTVDPDRIHLVNSALFDDLSGAYAGDPIVNAAEFQKSLINHIIVQVQAKYSGRLIIHTHDWMAGGVVTAYAKSWGCPILHTLHNVHTGHIPLDMFFGIDTGRISDYLYLSKENGRVSVDCQATAVKNASIVSFVGERFLREIVDNHFADQPILSSSLRKEVKEKYNHGVTLSILNAPSLTVFPENCTHLVRRYGVDCDILAAKRENRVEFQRRLGLNIKPEAILLYWPSRLDPSQKGIELLEQIAQKFVNEHDDVQIAIIGNGAGHDRTHEEICGRIACASGGRIAYQRFNESLSMLGFAAASDVFGASLYEPCGQIDQVGNLYGATATNRDTGGYHDKIQELCLAIDGAPEDTGNGFLFRDYDVGGLWYGLHRSVEFHRRPPDVREKQLRRIMRKVRQMHNVDRMVDEYIDVYERLNGNVPLT